MPDPLITKLDVRHHRQIENSRLQLKYSHEIFVIYKYKCVVTYIRAQVEAICV
jgi:hypothetical protein